MRAVIFLLIISLCLLNQASAISIDTLQQKLAAIDTVQAKFTSTRQLQGTDMTLESQGIAVFSKALGIAFRQTEPFNLSFTVTEDQVREENEGEAPKIYQRRSSPEVFKIADQIRTSLLNFDPKLLEDNFDIEFKDLQDNGYSMTLIPHDQGLLKLERIELKGDVFPTEVSYSMGGDNTVIHFSDISLAPLTQDYEKQIFN